MWMFICFSFKPKHLLYNSHTRLSATHLLGSPDGSRNPLAANSTGKDLINIAIQYLLIHNIELFIIILDNGMNSDGISFFNRISRPRSSLFSCLFLFSCQRSIKEYLARKKVGYYGFSSTLIGLNQR